MTARTAVLPEPNACALCDVPKRSHCQHFYAGHEGDERKGWVEPTPEVRLARMRARREARQRQQEVSSRG